MSNDTTTTGEARYRAAFDQLEAMLPDTDDVRELWYELDDAFGQALSDQYWSGRREVVQRFLAELNGPPLADDDDPGPAPAGGTGVMRFQVISGGLGLDEAEAA